MIKVYLLNWVVIILNIMLIKQTSIHDAKILTALCFALFLLSVGVFIGSLWYARRIVKEALKQHKMSK